MGRRSFLAKLISMFGLAGCSPARSEVEPALTLREFQDQVVDEISRRFPPAVVRRVGDAELRVALKAGEEEGVLNLERAYALYLGAPGQLAVLVRKTASSLESPDITAADRLVVLVRPVELVPEEADLVRPLAGRLVAAVAVDRPDNYVFAPPGELQAAFKLDAGGIWERALSATRATFDPLPGPVPPGEPVAIETADGLAASILVFDDVWDSPAMIANGPLVAAVLARDVLFLAPLSDKRSVGQFRKMMKEVRFDPNRLTDELLVRRGGKWEVLG